MAMLNACFRPGWLDGMRTKTEPSGYESRKHAMSCEVGPVRCVQLVNAEVTFSWSTDAPTALATGTKRASMASSKGAGEWPAASVKLEAVAT
jgi:hypothetical protein